MTEPKLNIELVPSSTWGTNLRSVLRISRWHTLRRWCYERAGHVCEICGGSGLEQGRGHAVECHERWQYDDVRGMQKLVGVIALCPACHRCKHVGRAIAVGAGKPTLRHLARVNGWSPEETEAHVAAAFAIQQFRSLHDWAIDLHWLIGDESPLEGDLFRDPPPS